MKVVIKEGDKIIAEIPIDKSKSFADQIVEAYTQGAREFAEWLYAKANVPIYDYYGRKTKTDDLLAEWQKERI